MKRLAITLALSLCVSFASAQSSDASPRESDETAPSEAEPTEAERRQALATQYYAVGAAAFEEGEFARAFASFRDSFELSGHPTLLYNLALTLDRLQRLEEAKAYYERYLSEHPRPVNPSAVRARVEIIARALAERTAAPTNNLAQPEQTAPDSDVHLEDTGPEPSESRVEGGLPSGAIVAFAVAGAGLLAFGTAGTYALVRRRDLDASCAPDCAPSDVDGARTAARIADVSLGVVAAGAVVGVVWCLVGRKRDEPAVTVTPAASRDGFGAHLVGRF